MKKIYLYMHHSGFDFFLSHREIPFAEKYCTDCEEADELLGVYVSESKLAEKLRELLTKGFDPIECDTYRKLTTKYNLPERRQQ